MGGTPWIEKASFSQISGINFCYSNFGNSKHTLIFLCVKECGNVTTAHGPSNLTVHGICGMGILMATLSCS